MNILSEIPFSLDVDQIMAQAHVEAGSSDAADLLELIELARKIGKPKAAYAVCFITARDGERVQIADVWFRSCTLVPTLASVERIFALLATCGHELDEAFPAKGDMLHAFWWDQIKSRLLGVANRFLSDHVHRRFRLGKTATMRPGSGDVTVWPIEQQAGLFRLLPGSKSSLACG